jgi:hypothetical protein
VPAALQFAADLLFEAAAEMTTVAGDQPVQPLLRVRRARIKFGDPLRLQQALDPICVGGSLFDQALAFAQQSPFVVLLDRRYTHGAQHLVLSARMGHQGTDHVAGIDPIGLGPLGAAVDEQTGGIDDDHLDP